MWGKFGASKGLWKGDPMSLVSVMLVVDVWSELKDEPNKMVEAFPDKIYKDFKQHIRYWTILSFTV